MRSMPLPPPVGKRSATLPSSVTTSSSDPSLLRGLELIAPIALALVQLNFEGRWPRAPASPRRWRADRVGPATRPVCQARRRSAPGRARPGRGRLMAPSRSASVAAPSKHQDRSRTGRSSENGAPSQPPEPAGSWLRGGSVRRGIPRPDRCEPTRPGARRSPATRPPAPAIPFAHEGPRARSPRSRLAHGAIGSSGRRILA